MGLGIGLLIAFPKTVISLTKPYEETEYLQADYGQAQLAYDNYIASKAKTSPSGTHCSCVLFAKTQTGYDQTVGYARNWPKNSTTPTIGGIVITNESFTGHVAYILAINPDTIEVIEANYSRCKVTTRKINLDSPVIMGYWERR